MNRFWIFLLVGPFIGFIGALFSGYLMAPLYLLLLLVFFYVFGAIPALLACLVDYCLAGRVGEFKRAAGTSLVGGVSSIFVATFFPDHVAVVSLGISGAVAGFICSLLSPRVT